MFFSSIDAKKDPSMDVHLFLAVIIESVSSVTQNSLWDHERIAGTGYHERKIHSGVISARHRSHDFFSGLC